MMRSPWNRSLCVLLVCASPLMAKDRGAATTVVDSGTFSVIVHGATVASEQFRIEKSAAGSAVHSEFRVAGQTQPSQTATMEITATGDLRRYEWQNPSAHATEVVEPKNEFVVEKLTYPGGPSQFKKMKQVAQKDGVSLYESEMPHLLPLSTPILDDNFFSHREILLWRYMASQCAKTTHGVGMQCDFKKATYGVLVPNQHQAYSIVIEYVGQDQMSLHGQPRVVDRYKLTSDEMIWNLYLDAASMKLLKMDIPSEGTEIVRD